MSKIQRPMKKAQAKEKASSCDEASVVFALIRLDVERRPAAAGALHVRVLELETGTLQRLDVIHPAAVQVHDRGGVHEHFKAVHIEHFVHHARAGVELQGVGEARASASHHPHAQASRRGILLRHDSLYLGNGIWGQANGCRFYFRWSRGRRGSCCGRHMYLLEPTNVNCSKRTRGDSDNIFAAYLRRTHCLLARTGLIVGTRSELGDTPFYGRHHPHSLSRERVEESLPTSLAPDERERRLGI